MRELVTFNVTRLRLSKKHEFSSAFITMGKPLAFPKVTLCPKAVCVIQSASLIFYTSTGLQGALEITRPLGCSREAGKPRKGGWLTLEPVS